MPETAFLITAAATLFVVIDPPGLVPMFIALTRGMSPCGAAPWRGGLA
jgi:multiple antibiotic resistance protein